MRLATFNHTIVRLGAGLELLDPAGPRRVAAAAGDGYAPYGALAVVPGGHTAWTRSTDGTALRVDLRTGAAERFDFQLVDAAFVDADTLVAAIVDGDRHRLVELSSADPARQRPVALPAAEHLDWPYGSPYQFGVYTTGDWAKETGIRLTGTRWGVVAVQANGLACIRWSDGRWACWRIPLAYQGWICGFCHADGVVFTSVHNGRTGDVVWVDHHGRWYDCFDSKWEHMGPCVPSGAGFVAAVGEELVRFAGYPAVIVAKVHIGEYPDDATVEHDGSRATLGFGERIVQIAADDARVTTREKDGSIESGALEVLRDAASALPWSWERIEDPDLGTLWQPDPLRTAALVRAVEADPRALDSIPGVGPPADQIASDPAGAVYRRLRRTVEPKLPRIALLGVLERLARSSERDPFVRWMLRRSLPEKWQSLSPSIPVADWLLDHIPALHEGLAGNARVRRCEIGAEPGRMPAWYVHVEIEGRAPMRARLVDFRAAALVAPPPGDDADDQEFDAIVDDADEADASVLIEPLPGGYAYGVTMKAAGTSASVQTGATFQPITLADPAQVRLLYYGGDADGLFVGRRDGRWVVDLRADGLDAATPTVRPAVRPEAEALLQRLVADDSLALRHEPDAELLWAVEAAVFGATDPDARASALEALLLDHDGVDDLFADTQQLKATIVALARE